MVDSSSIFDPLPLHEIALIVAEIQEREVRRLLSQWVSELEPRLFFDTSYRLIGIGWHDQLTIEAYK